MDRAGEGAFALLRSLEVFRSLSDADLQELAQVCRGEEPAGGTVMFREGDEAGSLYVVVDGEVEIWKGYGTAGAERITVLGPGRVFGEMALVDGEPRSATVVTASAARLLAVTATDFRDVLRRNPALALAVQQLLATRVRRSTDRFLDDLKRKNARLEETLAELRDVQDELISQERLSTVGRFASLILHDLRKPITSVVAYADLLLHRDDLPEAARDYAAEIRRSSRILDDMAREMLDYSKGDIRLDVTAVDVPAFMSEIEKVLAGMVISRKVDVQVGCTFPGSFPFDRERMIRVFFNLADNAIKALGQRGRLTVTAEAAEEGLRFIVRDTGIGMDEAALQHIFEPFYSSARGGTGLGMVAVRNVVEAHGGTVAVDSSPGGGTTVTVALPSTTAR